jgi:hypothetical protein
MISEDICMSSNPAQARCTGYNIAISGFLWVLRFPPPIELTLQHLRATAKTGSLGIRIMCPSGTSCIPEDLCQ